LASEAKGRAFESRRLHQQEPPQTICGGCFLFPKARAAFEQQDGVEVSGDGVKVGTFVADLVVQNRASVESAYW